MTPLPTLGGESGLASWINSRGELSGMAENSRWDTTRPPPQKFEFKPVVWVNGQVQELPTISGDSVGGAFAINDSGQAVGASGSCSTYNPYIYANFQPLHALVWQAGMVTDLGNLGGTGKGGGNIAFGINNKGQVVGNSDLRGDKVNHAFLWQSGNLADLGTLPGDVSSAAIGINDSGVVAGLSLDKDGNPRAVVVQNGVMSDLNDLTPADSPLYLLLACAINSNGEIIGQAVDESGEIHGYLAVPSAGAAPTSSISPALQTAARAKVLSEGARKALQQRLPLGRFGMYLPQAHR